MEYKTRFHVPRSRMRPLRSFTSLSLSLSLSLSVCVSVCLSPSLSVYLCLSLSLCVCFAVKKIRSLPALSIPIDAALRAWDGSSRTCFLSFFLSLFLSFFAAVY